MGFSIEKYVMLAMKSGTRDATEEIEGPNQEVMVARKIASI